VALQWTHWKGLFFTGRLARISFRDTVESVHSHSVCLFKWPIKLHLTFVSYPQRVHVYCISIQSNLSNLYVHLESITSIISTQYPNICRFYHLEYRSTYLYPPLSTLQILKSIKSLEKKRNMPGGFWEIWKRLSLEYILMDPDYPILSTQHHALYPDYPLYIYPVPFCVPRLCLLYTMLCTQVVHSFFSNTQLLISVFQNSKKYKESWEKKKYARGFLRNLKKAFPGIHSYGP
jgi:hypothetical protein